MATAGLRELIRQFQHSSFKGTFRNSPRPRAGITLAGAAGGIIPFVFYWACVLLVVAAISAPFLAWSLAWTLLWGVGSAIAHLRRSQSTNVAKSLSTSLPEKDKWTSLMIVFREHPGLENSNRILTGALLGGLDAVRTEEMADLFVQEAVSVIESVESEIPEFNVQEFLPKFRQTADVKIRTEEDSGDDRLESLRLHALDSLAQEFGLPLDRIGPVTRRHDQQGDSSGEDAGSVLKPEVRSVADELAKLAQLRDSGVLTEEEFAVQKAKLLS